MKPRALPVSQHEAAALHDGRQTMFRRVIYPPPIWASFMGEKPVPAFHPDLLTKGVIGMAIEIFNSGGQNMVKCPYAVGRRLWVQETWWVYEMWDCRKPSEIQEGVIPYYTAHDYGRAMRGGVLRPSTQMQRWASRTLLEVVAVKAEELQRINAYDACLQGALSVDTESVRPGYMAESNTCSEKGEKPPLGPGPIERFRYQWNADNVRKGHGWDLGEWVWAVTVEKVDGKEGGV